MGKGRFPLAHKTLLTWAGEVSPSHETQPPLVTEELVVVLGVVLKL